MSFEQLFTQFLMQPCVSVKHLRISEDERGVAKWQFGLLSQHFREIVSSSVSQYGYELCSLVTDKANDLRHSIFKVYTA